MSLKLTSLLRAAVAILYSSTDRSEVITSSWIPNRNKYSRSVAINELLDPRRIKRENKRDRDRIGIKERERGIILERSVGTGAPRQVVRAVDDPGGRGAGN